MESPIKRAQSLLEEPDPQPDEVIIQLTPLVNQENPPWPVLHFIGLAFLFKKEFDMALTWLQKAVEAGDDERIAYHGISICYYSQDNFEKAEEFEKQALEKEDFYDGWMHLGAIYRTQAKLKEALDCFLRAADIEPDNKEITYHLAEIYRDNGRLDKSLELFESIIDTDEKNFSAYISIAEILIKKQEFDEAEKYLNLILEEDEENISANTLLTHLCRQKGNYERALEICEKVLQKEPTSIVRLGYAVCLQELGEFDRAEQNYLQVLKDNPDKYHALSDYLMSMHYNPEKSKQEIFEAHKKWDEHFAPEERPERPEPSEKKRDKKLRIGLLSGGFRRHPVGYMITGGLERLPSDEFDIYCYATNNQYDDLTERIFAASDQWRSVVEYKDQIIAQMIREDEIDILLEMSGHADNNRLRTVAMEPTPVIVKWVGGLFNTTGLKSVDFLITDRYETPAGEEEFYTEKLVRLPHDYISYLPPHYAPDVTAPPVKENEYITFGCFNNPTKINEQILSHWAVIMNRLPDSRLMLKSKQYETSALKKRVIEKLSKSGISKDRLIFKGQTPHRDHLSKYSQIDIALDPWPYSGGLTTCEALWMGVPVITKPGPTFAGRHAKTHLTNAGFSEWVVDTWQEYIETSVSLAEDWERLEELRFAMREQVNNSPLCDGRRFGAHLSEALHKIWNQWVDGYESGNENWQEHIDVKALSEKEIKDKTDRSRAKNEKHNPEQEYEDVETAADNIASIRTEAISTKSNGQIFEKLPNINVNGKDHSVNRPQILQAEEKPDTFKIETVDSVKVCTPPNFELLTPYVLLEQEQWFEPELDFVREYLKPGMNAIDVGAGFGAYALPMASLIGKEGDLYAFEPGLSARRHLEKSKIENNLENMHVFGRAVADQTDQAKLKIADTPELNKLDENGKIEVPQTTLDAWWQFVGETAVDFIKLDVNGAESRVISGADRLLSDQSPVILLAVGEGGMESKQEAEKELKEYGYKFYEYIPRLKLLAVHDPQQEIDPYLMNLIAIKKDRIREFQKSGWIYDKNIEVEEPKKGSWRRFLQDLPWTDSIFSEWERHANHLQQRDYLRALDYLCLAEELDSNETASRIERSKKGMLAKQGVQILVELYNSGDTGIPVSLTLVRGLNLLGQRGQAVRVMKSIMETNKLGELVSYIKTPFMLPLPEQDHSQIQTNFKQWLTVRMV
ncbi:MAG TPA: FkbM family methyltransferase, partial [Balneolaceae bacterium]|nr:FkbM family methyltransferase [Balneolaceae bacterium]